MYTQEEKRRAIELFIQSKQSVSAVISSLGYPSPNILRRWYREYKANNESIRSNKGKYTEEYKKSVIDSYLENGQNMSATAKQFGLPSSTLCDWIHERQISHQPDCVSGSDVVKYSSEHKLMVVTESVCGTEADFRLCAKYGISQTTLANWRKQLLGIDSQPNMSNNKESSIKKHKLSKDLKEEELRREYDALLKELENKESQLQQTSMERDVLKVTLQVLKK